MSDTLLESLEFNVVAGRNNNWATLVSAQTRLNNLVASAEKFATVMAGLEGKVSVKLNTRELEQMLKQNPLTKLMGKNLDPEKVAKVFGADDATFAKVVAKMRAQQELAEKEYTKAQAKVRVVQRQMDGATGKKKSVIAESLREATSEADKLKAALDKIKFFSNPNKSGEFANPGSAAAFGSYYQSLQNKSAKAAGGTGGTYTASPEGVVQMVIPVNRIEAILGPGNVKLVVPGDRVDGVGKSGTNQEGTKAGKSGGGKAGGAGGTPVGGELITETITEYPGGKKPKTIARQFITDLDQQITTFTDDLKGEFKRVTRNSKTGKTVADLQEKLAGIQNEIKEMFGSAAAVRRDPKRAAAFFTSQADTVASFQNPSLAGAGLGSWNNKFGALESSLRGKAADALAFHTQQEAERAAAAKTSLDQFAAAGENARHKIAATRAQTAQFDAEEAAARTQAQQIRSMSQSHAQLALEDFKNRGGTLQSANVKQGWDKNGPSQRGTSVYALESGGNKELMTVKFTEAGASVEHLTRKMTEARAEAGYLGGDFVKNTIKVTAWAASVGVLYKTMELANTGFAQMVEVSGQTARLDQIFSKVGGSAQQLTADILHLAAANGRSGDEAMEAAIDWARFGYTRVQVNEAVRLSLMSANVAQLSSAESTQHLQAIMKNYGFTLGEMASKLGEMNQMTNIYNATNADLLQGVSRTAAVAKQAGLPFEELLGILAATIGATKQSGANIGNAIKSITLSLSNPELQKKLRLQFGFESTTGGENLKTMSQLMSDLFVKYEKMGNLQRQSLLFSVGGKTQASRLSAILDNYVQSQVLAINAQLHLNSAEQENLKITASLKAQLTGLATEWERFAVIQGSNGPAKVLGEIAAALRNVISLMNAPGMNLLVTGMMGIGVASAARLALTGFRGGGQGFLGRSGARIAGAASTAMSMTDTVVRDYVMTRNNNAGRGSLGSDIRTRRLGFYSPGGAAPIAFTTSQMGLMSKLVFNTNLLGDSFLKVGKSSEISSRGVKLFFGALGGGLKLTSAALAFLGEFLVPLVAIGALVAAFNAGMEAIGLSSERSSQKLAGFNTEVEKAHAAAAAFAMSSRLMQTAQNALTPERGIAMRPEDAHRLIADVSQAAFASEPDLAKQKSLTEEFQKQLTILNDQKNVRGMQELLARRIEVLNAARRTALLAEREGINAGVISLTQEIARLQGKRAGFWGFVSPEKRDRDLAAKQQQLGELQGARVKNILDDEEAINNALEERLSYDARHLGELEKQKVALEGVAAMFDAIKTTSPFEKAQIDLVKLDAQSAITQKRIEILQTGGSEAGKKERAEKVAELKAQREILIAAQSRATKDLDNAVNPGNATDDTPMSQRFKNAGRAMASSVMSIGGGNLSWIQDQTDAIAKLHLLHEQLDQNTTDQQSAAAGTLPGMGGQEDHLAKIAEEKKYNADLRAIAVERAGIEANLKLAENRTLFGFGQDLSNRNLTRNSFGRNPTDVLNRQREGLNAEISTLQKNPNADIAERGQLLEDIYLKTKNLQDLINREPEIQKEINQLIIDRNKEFTKSFFGDGPAEMLKKLSAFRLAFDDKGKKRGDLSQGQFFSMDPGSRANYGMLNPGFDPHMIELKNELKTVVGAIVKEFGSFDPKVINQKFISFADDLATAAKGLKDMFPTSAVEAAADVIEKAGSRMSKALDAVSARLEGMLARLHAPTPAGVVNGTVRLSGSTPGTMGGGGMFRPGMVGH